MQLEPFHYDRIGEVYARHRQPDPRLAIAILSALGDAQHIVNVGAGTGSYEPSDRTVIAVEPSYSMIQSRPHYSTSSIVCAAAEQLPFADETFDAALAILSIHHWSDWQAGLREMQRVSHERVVLFTWDPAHTGFWLVQDYFPDLLGCDRQIFPAISAIASVLGAVDVQVVPIPHDCVDGFLGAYWRRPSAYLDPGVRAAISSFSRIQEILPRLDRLRSDLECGDWVAQHADLLTLDQLDMGYRLVIHSKGKR